MFQQVVGTAVAYLDLDTSKFNTGLQTAWQQMQSIGDESLTMDQKFTAAGQSMKTAGSTLTKNVTLPIAAAFGYATKKTMDFEEALSNVKALAQSGMKDPQKEMEQLKQKAMELGGSTKFTSKEVADAFGYMALAGWKTEDMLDGISGVLDLAASSGMDLAKASDLVTDYLSAFGKEADYSTKMADMLSYAQANTNTTTEMLGDAFGNSAALMNTAGQSMDTTIALLGALANEGLKGSEAGTALSATMRDIYQKMSKVEDAADATSLAESGLVSVTGDMNDLIGKQVIQIGDWLVPVSDINGNFRDMIDIVADVQKATNGMASAEKTAALSTTFTSRSIKGMSILLEEGADYIGNFRNELLGADGTAKEMSKTMLDNLAGSITYLTSAIDNLLIKLGDKLAPLIRKFADWLTNITQKLTEMSDEQFEMIVKIGLLVAALGPLLTILGNLFTLLGGIIKVGSTVVTGISKIAGLLSSGGSLTVGITTFITKLAGIGTTIAGVITFVKNFIDMWQNGVNLIKTALSVLSGALTGLGLVILGLASPWAIVIGAAVGALAAIVAAIHEHWEEIKTWASETWEKVKGWFSEKWESIKTWWANLKEKVKGAFDKAVEGIKEFFKTIGDNINTWFKERIQDIVEFFSNIWEKVSTWFKDLLEKISNFFKDTYELVTGKIKEIWDSVVEKAKEIWDKMVEFFQKIFDKIQEVWENLTRKIKEIYEDIKEKVTAIFEGLIKIIEKLFDTVKTVIEKLIDVLKGVIDNFVNVVKQIFEIAKGIITNIIDTIKTMVEKVIDFVKKLIENALTVIQKLWDGVKNFVKNAFEKIVGGIKDVMEKLWNWIKEFPEKFIEIGKKVIEKIKDGFAAGWNILKGWVEEHFGWIMDIVEKIKGAWDTVKNVGKSAWNKLSGSHANGLDYVPYDGYVAELHKGERVLTKTENESYNSGSSSSGDTYNFYNVKDDPYEYARQIRRTKKELQFG